MNLFEYLLHVFEYLLYIYFARFHFENNEGDATVDSGYHSTQWHKGPNTGAAG